MGRIDKNKNIIDDFSGLAHLSRRMYVTTAFLFIRHRNLLDDDMNKFNRSMNRGKALAQWFASDFGSIQCRAITGCSFSSGADVEKYIQGEHIARCEVITCRVAEETVAILKRAQVK